MLIDRYLTSNKNLPAVLKKIIDGTAPKKFTAAHLKGLGFTSSNDQGIPRLLKGIGFLGEDGSPTKRYHDYRDASQSKAVMAEALREAYGDLFHINSRPSTKDRAAIEGKFKATHNVNERIAALQAATFFALLKEADLDATKTPAKAIREDIKQKPDKRHEESKTSPAPSPEKHQRPTFHYNIQVHLPATKDVEVYNAIFKSMKEHFFDG